jgi:RNA polymerase sigma-70 factor, ECF subfamily
VRFFRGFLPLTAPAEKISVLSFETVYERYFDFVWAMARRFGIASDAMDDVVQEVFMVVHAKLHTLERPESARSWLYGIVRRVASGHRRKRGGDKFESGVAVEELPGLDGLTSPANLAEQNDRVRRLWSLLATIEPAKREVFVMAELEEFTCPEIAEALELPLNTVYSRLRYAREAFETALARHKLRTGAGP